MIRMTINKQCCFSSGVRRRHGSVSETRIERSATETVRTEEEEGHCAARARADASGSGQVADRLFAATTIARGPRNCPASERANAQHAKPLPPSHRALSIVLGDETREP